MTPKRIAVITYHKLPDGHESDRAAFAHLESLGMNPVPVIWNDPAVDWAGFDGVVFRSCWDYHHTPAQFAALLERLEALQVRALNPIDVVRWNMNKLYLRELTQKGVNVIPSLWLTETPRQSLHDLMRSQGWDEVVVKPVISADAHLTERITLAQAADGQTHLERVIASGGAIIQRFMPEIVDAGEWSIIFIGGEYSHSLIKRPLAGDFRVQGGIWNVETPPAAFIDAARAILAHVPSSLLYARVDGVIHAGQFALMELELIEPYLGLHLAEESPQRFAAALAQMMA